MSSLITSYCSEMLLSNHEPNFNSKLSVDKLQEGYKYKLIVINRKNGFQIVRLVDGMRILNDSQITRIIERGENPDHNNLQMSRSYAMCDEECYINIVNKILQNNTLHRSFIEYFYCDEYNTLVYNEP